MTRVKANIDKLCSKEFYGRGYVKSGVQKSATFLEQEFRQMGLKAFDGQYQQPFTHAVNTFPDAISLTVNGQKLQLGQEYLVEASSASGSGKANVVALPAGLGDEKLQEKAANTIAKTDYSGKAVQFPIRSLGAIYALPKPAILSLIKAKCWIATSDVLTHRIADHQLPVPFFVVKHKADDKKIKKVEYAVQSTMVKDFESANVIGYLEGTQNKDSIVVFCAHYDHLGGMGDQFYPGAHDNASGVSMLLEMAHYYAKNPPSYTVVFIAFAGEEAGLLGSKHFVAHPLFPIGQISFLLNLDLFATADDGIMVVNGQIFEDAYQMMVQINDTNKYLPEVKPRGKSQNSDHYPFTERGVKGFFFYVLGNWQHYHSVNDAPPLPLKNFEGCFGLIRDFADAWMGGERK
jgi:hypothetical protein